MEYVCFITNVFTQNENMAHVIEVIGAFLSELKAVMNINHREWIRGCCYYG